MNKTLSLLLISLMFLVLVLAEDGDDDDSGSDDSGSDEGGNSSAMPLALFYTSSPLLLVTLAPVAARLFV